MLLPHEINKKEFTHAIGGYARGEVKSYLEYVAVNYEKLRRENDELSRKLDAACAKLDEYQRKEAEAEVTFQTAKVSDKKAGRTATATGECGRDIEKRISDIRNGALLGLRAEIDRITAELTALEKLVSPSADEFESSDEASAEANSAEIIPEEEISEAEDIEDIVEEYGAEETELDVVTVYDAADNTDGDADGDANDDTDGDADGDAVGDAESEAETAEEDTDKVWDDILNVLTEQVMALEINDEEPMPVDAETEDIEDIIDIEDIENVEDIDEIIDADEISTDEDITVEDFTDLLILDGGEDEEALDEVADEVEEVEEVDEYDAENAEDADTEAEADADNAETAADIKTIEEIEETSEIEEAKISDVKIPETELSDANEPEQLSLDDIMSLVADEIGEIEETDEIEEAEGVEETEEVETTEEYDESEKIEDVESIEAAEELEPDIDDIMELINGAVSESIEKAEIPASDVYPKRIYHFRRGRKTQPVSDETESLLEALKRQYQSGEENADGESADADEDFDIHDYDEFDFTFADTDDKIETVPTEYDINDF